MAKVIIDVDVEQFFATMARAERESGALATRLAQLSATWEPHDWSEWD